LKTKVTFGKLKIQQLNRIAIPNSLLENLDLKVSDEVELFLDIEKGEIIVKKVKGGEKDE